MSTTLALRLRKLADDIWDAGYHDLTDTLHSTARQLERYRIADPEVQFQLCYVDGCWAWFANCNPDEVWGDDWNDSPYEHNAGDPYTSDSYKLVKVAFDANLHTPADLNPPNSRWSVQDLNAGRAAWLSSYTGTPVIWAGCALPLFLELIEAFGGKVYCA